MIRRFLDPDSIGWPQFIAAALLFVYLLECAWVVWVEARRGGLPDSSHALCIYYGLEQWRGKAIAGTPDSLRSEALTGLPSAGWVGRLRARDGYDEDHSPLYYLTCAAPLLVKPFPLPANSPQGQLWATGPYLFFGVMLGGSLWYVTRRLYSNAGGYIALVLYCFSPGMILSVAGPHNSAELGGVWGAFGAVFTAIAVAHTLYAPREVILWNGRRILLLGLSLALAVGNQFSMAVIAVVALFLMFWVAPVRPRAVIGIWSCAVAVGVVWLLAFYSFYPTLLWRAVLHARWIDMEPAAFGMFASYSRAFKLLVTNSPPLLLALPSALIGYFSWRRARYFGNTAPLLVAALMLILALGSPGFPGQGFHLVMLLFFFVFVAGIFADLLETRQKLFVAAVLGGLLGASVGRNLLELARLAWL